MVPEREHGSPSAMARPRRGLSARASAAARRSRDEDGRPEGQQRRAEQRGDPARPAGRRASWLDSAGARPTAARGSVRACRGVVPERRSRISAASVEGARPPRRVGLEGAVDGREQARGQVRALRGERRRAALDRGGDLLKWHAPERMLPASASHRSTPTAQTSLAGVASSPARRSGAMYASVPGRRRRP